MPLGFIVLLRLFPVVIAIAQERRMWPIAAMPFAGYTINMVVVPNVDIYWLSLN